LRLEVLRHGWVKKVSIPTTTMKCRVPNTMYRIYTFEKASNVRLMYMMLGVKHTYLNELMFKSLNTTITCF
jgi:hypothetical protein